MTDQEFYAQILARVLIEAGADISIGGKASKEIVEDMVEMRCCELVKEIHAVLGDDTLDDPSCFQRVEKIVSLYERLGPGGGSRHDFG